MIFLDMDGTLLDSNGYIKEESKRILSTLKQQGKIIVIVTGRILSSTLELLSSDYVNYILANNGSVWYSYQSSRIIYKSVLNKKEFAHFFHEMITDFKKISFSTVKWYQFFDTLEVEKFLESNEDIYQVNIDLKNNSIEEIAQKAKITYPNLQIQVMQDSFSDEKWLEILHKDINKGNSIIAFSKFMDKTLENAICFGDGLNDLTMLEVCGIPVAMGNALPELKKKAKYITKSNDQNGISYFLEHYFDKGGIL